MSDFDELLDAAVEQLTSKPETADVEVLLGGKLVTFRFKELPSIEWANLTAANPQRLNSVIDLNYGYNFHAVCEGAAPLSGVRVDGGEEVALTVEQWQKVFKAVSAPGRGAITDAIWSLNEFAPSQRMAKAKKASTGDSKRKPSSPEN